MRALVLVMLVMGCAAAPAGSQPHVADLYPDEFQATLEAWVKLKGEPGDVRAALQATVTYGSSREVTEACHGGTPLTGCTTVDGDHINIMLVPGDDQPWLVCHEFSHAIRGAILGNGDPNHTDPEIWGQDGVVNAAATAMARQRATISPPATL